MHGTYISVIPYTNLILFYLATQCTVSTTPGEASAIYNFSCTNLCSYWVFYILDYPVPMSGCRYTLPCKVDTVSISDQARVARSELGYKVDKSSSNGAISINVTRGNLMMVAQCVMADMATYLDGVMVRVGKYHVQSDSY